MRASVHVLAFGALLAACAACALATAGASDAKRGMPLSLETHKLPQGLVAAEFTAARLSLSLDTAALAARASAAGNSLVVEDAPAASVDASAHIAIDAAPATQENMPLPEARAAATSSAGGATRPPLTPGCVATGHRLRTR